MYIHLDPRTELPIDFCEACGYNTDLHVKGQCPDAPYGMSGIEAAALAALAKAEAEIEDAFAEAAEEPHAVFEELFDQD